MPQRRGRGGSGLAARHRLRIAGEPIPARPQHALAPLCFVRCASHAIAHPCRVAVPCQESACTMQPPGTCCCVAPGPRLQDMSPAHVQYSTVGRHCCGAHLAPKLTFRGALISTATVQLFVSRTQKHLAELGGGQTTCLFVFVIFGYSILFSPPQSGQMWCLLAPMTNTFLFLSYSDIKYYFRAARSGSPRVHFVTFSGP